MRGKGGGASAGAAEPIERELNEKSVALDRVAVVVRCVHAHGVGARVSVANSALMRRSVADITSHRVGPWLGHSLFNTGKF